MSSVVVLVVSCDKYADLWNPFFAIFWKRWPDCPYPVYLGSNRRSHSDPRVRTLAVGEDTSWASGVLRMLECIPSPYVILLLEDFLIEEPVDTAAVQRLADFAVAEGLGCLRLAPLPPPTPLPSRSLPAHPELGVVEAGSPYRVSAQAAVWRVETLRRLLVPGFSAWDFEHIGSRMSSKMPELFCGTFRPFLAYDHGVEKGKWKPEGVAICRDAGIEPDLAARPVFTPEELAAHYAGGVQESRLNEVKQGALSSFLAGRRAEGLCHALRYLKRKPFSVQGWGIAAFGLLGPGPLAWLRDRQLQMKLAKYGWGG